MTEQAASNDVYQRAFNAGLYLGLVTACASLRRGEQLSDLERLTAEMKDAKERMEGKIDGRRMERGDIFLERPLMQPGDLGMTKPGHVRASDWLFP